jgi:2-iminobutanoate/2-iminopropanoate deaminase
MNTHRRRSIEVEGVGHGAAPIPMAARVGNVLYSSGIPGVDPTTGKLADGAAAQAACAFGNMQALLKNGGATLADVVRMTVYVKDASAREPVNAEWLRCFPDPHDRPARHTLNYDLQHGMLLQLEIVAVIDEAS